MPPPLRLIPGGLPAPTPQDVAGFAPRAPVVLTEADVPPFTAQVPPMLARPIPSEPLGFDPSSPLGMDIGGNPQPPLQPREMLPAFGGPLALVPRQTPELAGEGPVLDPAFLGGPAPQESPQAAAPNFYDRFMRPGATDPAYAPPAAGTPAAARAAQQVTGPQRPRLLGSPRARVEAPAAEPPNFIDQLTNHQGPIWQDPRETPYDRERRALAAATQLEQQRAEMLGAQAMERADAEEAYRARQADLENQRRQAEGEARASMQRAADRLAQMRVDPSRYYRNAGVVGMLGNAIAIGLGAMGEALGGGPNVALQQINAAIDRDIASQEQDIATAGADVENRRGILSEVQRDFVTRQGALEATRAIMLRELAAQAEAQAANQGSAEAIAQGRALRDQLLTAQEQAAAAAQAAEIEGALNLRRTAAEIRLLEARASQQETRAQRMAGMGAGGPAVERVSTPQMQAFDAMVAAGVDRAEAAARAGLPAGMVPPGNPITTEQRSPLDALDAALRHVESLVPAEGDIEGAGVVDANIPNFLQSDRGLELRVAIEDMIDLYGRVRSGAAITEAEREAFRRNLLGSGTERELRAGLAQLRREISARLGRGGARAGGASMMDQSAAGLTRVE